MTLSFGLFYNRVKTKKQLSSLNKHNNTWAYAFIPASTPEKKRKTIHKYG